MAISGFRKIASPDLLRVANVNGPGAIKGIELQEFHSYSRP